MENRAGEGGESHARGFGQAFGNRIFATPDAVVLQDGAGGTAAVVVQLAADFALAGARRLLACFAGADYQPGPQSSRHRRSKVVVLVIPQQDEFVQAVDAEDAAIIPGAAAENASHGCHVLRLG